MLHTKRNLVRAIVILAAISASLIYRAAPVTAQTVIPEKPVYIYLFWGESCPHCAAAKPFFESLPARYPGVIYRSYEVYYDQQNQQFFTEMAEKYGIQQFAVPTFFVGPYFLHGYSDELAPDIEKVIAYCLVTGCVDAAEGLTPAPSTTASPITSPVSTQPAITVTPALTAAGITTPAETPTAEPAGFLDKTSALEIPLIGRINLESQPVIISTALIALVDGFNPCSLWVLSMLLALTLHTGSRKKIFVIGLVFLTVTAAIYALFIAGLFSVLSITGYLGWIQALVAIIALVFALVNIKDYFWFKEGISFTISDEKKTGIFKRIRAVLDASQSWWGLISATVILAAGVSIVEFSCTAGFPIIWVNLLSAQNIGGGTFLALLLIYMLIYQLDELVIFFSAVISLRSNRLEEKHGRLLKLIGGMLMLTLSVTMLIDPGLINNLTASLIIFLIAFSLTALVVFIHRVLLPGLGIKTGSKSAYKKD